jgi:ACR3 family arsenite efflux pump ArsB
MALLLTLVLLFGLQGEQIMLLPVELSLNLGDGRGQAAAA